MSEHFDTTPELTLTPDTAAAAAPVPEEPSLTLNPTLNAEEVAAAQKERDAHAVKLDESQLSEAERKMVEEFSQKIDITAVSYTHLTVPLRLRRTAEEKAHRPKLH